ncbi:hypothetical protein GF369_03135 [Candidatus Peregrinibacteria bacterium]|nr:hypothetical protein [Candidatus Peregrinibacteria bacterium]
MKRLIGTKGERYAALFLRKRGYCVIHQNVYTPRSEIDIIARKDATLCFIEVKARKTLCCGLPEESLTTRKYRLLIKSAWWYMHHYGYTGLWRIDLIALLMNSFDEVEDIRHYRHVAL